MSKKPFDYVTGRWALTRRNKLGLNQSAFWGVAGVGQPAGSRYESGRTIPHPTRMLLLLAYGNAQDKAKVTALLGAAAEHANDVYPSKSISLTTTEDGYFQLDVPDQGSVQLTRQELIDLGLKIHAAIAPHDENGKATGALIVDLPAENGHEALTVIHQSSGYLLNDEETPMHASAGYLGNQIYKRSRKPASNDVYVLTTPFGCSAVRLVSESDTHYIVTPCGDTATPFQVAPDDRGVMRVSYLQSGNLSVAKGYPDVTLETASDVFKRFSNGSAVGRDLATTLSQLGGNMPNLTEGISPTPQMFYKEHRDPSDGADNIEFKIPD